MSVKTTSSFLDCHRGRVVIRAGEYDAMLNKDRLLRELADALLEAFPELPEYDANPRGFIDASIYVLREIVAQRDDLGKKLMRIIPSPSEDDNQSGDHP